MEYINCFQITSLVLVTMIAIHYFSHKRLNNAENRNFVCFLAFSGVYVLLDMLSAVIAGGGSSLRAFLLHSDHHRKTEGEV